MSASEMILSILPNTSGMSDDDDAVEVAATTADLSIVNASVETYVPPEVSLVTAVPMTLIYLVIFVTGIVGNICTCIVIARNKSMHTATNYYLFSLAVSDLFLLVLGLPQEVYQLWSPAPYIFGESFCIFRGLAAETSANASILLITAFTIERYLAICHPLRSHTMSKLSRAVKLILAIWVVAALCAIPLAIQFGIVYFQNNPEIAESASCGVKSPLKHSFEISTFLFFCLPMTVITALYLLIGLKLRGSSVKQQPPQPAHNGHKDTQQVARQQSANSRRAVIKMLVAVVVAFFLCWAPFHAQRLLAIYASQPPSFTVQTVYNILMYISGVLYYVSATINPILYHIMSLKFRAAFKDTLMRCCGRRSATSRGDHANSVGSSAVFGGTSTWTSKWNSRRKGTWRSATGGSLRRCELLPLDSKDGTLLHEIASNHQ